MTELTKALLKVQKDLPTIGKDSDNPFFKSKYASLSKIMSVALPILHKHGVFVSQAPDHLDGQPTLVTNLVHAESGEQVTSTMPLFLVKHDPQAQGSAITYARRYALVSMLGLVVDEDDDGNRASNPVPPAKEYVDQSAAVKAEAIERMNKLGFKGVDALNISEVLTGKKLPKTFAEWSKLNEALKNYNPNGDVVLPPDVDINEEPSFDE